MHFAELSAESQRGCPALGRRMAMTILPHSMLVAARPARWWSAFARSTIGGASVAADAAVIIGVSVLIGLAYHLAIYGSVGPLRGFVAVGASAAGIFVLPAIFRGEYTLSNYLSFRSHARRAFAYWNMTFVVLLALAFVTRALDDYSRASMILFYAMGLPAVVLIRYALVSTVILGSKVGLVTAQRVFLIGTAEDIGAFVRRYQPWNFGLHTVGAASLTRLDPWASSAARAAAPPRPGRGAGAGAPARSGGGLHRHAMVRDWHDRRLRQRVPENAGRD